jgi:hypothetical protein
MLVRIYEGRCRTEAIGSRTERRGEKKGRYKHHCRVHVLTTSSIEEEGKEAEKEVGVLAKE